MEAPFRVGDWQVQPLRNEIAGPDGRTKLEPRVMQVLVCLAERAGDVVSREQILEAVWEDRFVSDEVLTVAIQKLRRALGDDAKDPRFVQTVPGKGYRLNGAVGQVADTSAKHLAGPKSPKPVMWAVGVALAIFVTILLTRALAPMSEDREAARIAITPPPEAVADTFVISPDGKRLAFIAPNSEGVDTIWVRELDSGNTQTLAGTENVWRLFWSPDSRQIAFSTASQLKRVALSGERPVTLRDIALWGSGAWSDDNIFVLSRSRGGVSAMQAAGGEPTPLVFEDGLSPNAHRAFPFFLPDQTHFLYFASHAFERGRIFVGSLESPESVFLVESDSKAIYADGYLLFVQGGVLLAQTFDTDSLQLRGQPRVIEAQMMFPAVNGGPDTSLSVSRNGILAFRSATAPAGQLVWFDRKGRELTRIPQPSSGEYVNPSLSPDGRTIAANRRDPSTGNVDIWLIDVATGGAFRFTNAVSPETDLVWSPDGERVVFGAYRDGHHGLWLKPTAGGDEELLWQAPQMEILLGVIPRDWAPDGDIVLFDTTLGAPFDLLAVRVSGTREAWAILDSESSEVAAQLSPNGEWIAYASNETGAFEVYVMSFPDGKSKQRISVDGGTHPQWRQDGKELFYWGGTNRVATIMRTDVAEDAAGFRAGVPEPVFDHRIIGLLDGRSNYAVTPDGQRFLLRRPSLNPPPVTVIVNWTAALAKP